MTTTQTPHDHSNPDPLLTVAQAAEYLNLSDPHVRRAIRTGDLQAVRFGRAVRVRTSCLRTYLETQEGHR